MVVLLHSCYTLICLLALSHFSHTFSIGHLPEWHFFIDPGLLYHHSLFPKTLISSIISRNQLGIPVSAYLVDLYPTSFFSMYILSPSNTCMCHLKPVSCTFSPILYPCWSSGIENFSISVLPILIVISVSLLVLQSPTHNLIISDLMAEFRLTDISLWQKIPNSVPVIFSSFPKPILYTLLFSVH